MSSSTIPQRPAEWTQSVGDFVTSVTWAPDGTSLAVAGSAGPITLFTAAGNRLKAWPGHAGGTFAAQFSPRDAVLASVGQDGHARLWRPDSDLPVAEIAAGAAWVEQLAWSPEGTLCAVGAGRHTKLIRPDGTVAHALAPLSTTVTAFAWRADGRVLAGACYGRIQLWNADSGAEDAPLLWKTPLISLAWSSDRRWLVAGTQEQSVQIWEQPFRPGEELAMSGYAAKVRELAWHHGGRYLATGGGTEVMVWDCGGRGPAGSTPRILEGHSGRITALSYQPTGHLLASGGEDGRVLLWNAGKSSTAMRQFRLSAAVTSLNWSRDNGRLAIGCRDGTVAVAAPPA